VQHTRCTLSCDPGIKIVIDKIAKEYVKSQALRELIVTRHPRLHDRALVGAGGVVFPAMIGRSGKSVFKREGDGATPVASMRLLHGYYRSDRIRLPQTRLPLEPIRADLGWCDAPDHPSYNRPVRLPFDHSHELLMRDDGLYDVCLVLDWNIRARRRQGGSAIFFHLADPAHGPTEGCLAISRKNMLRLLPSLAPTTIVRVR
jgi:L,D-peptidoglycan transpeptidase YkuD (ErfK/YbiS/YcfS/YnhG family)